MAHVHAHGHTHAHDGDDPVTSPGTQRALIGAVVAVALIALVGLVLLWPDGDRPVLAEELGMGAELVDAKVTGVEVVPCLGTREADGVLCEEVRFDVTSGSSQGDAASFEIGVNEASAHIDPGDPIVVSYEPANAPGFQYFFHDFQREMPMLALVTTSVRRTSVRW